MNKRNLIIQAAVACAFGAASLSSFAGVATGFPEQMASQAVLSNSTVIRTGALAYGTQSVIAEPSTVYLYVKLNNGALFKDTAGTAIILPAALVAANLGAATVTVGTGSVSTDSTFAVFPLTVSVASVPVNATFTFRPTGVAATDGAVFNAFAAATAGTLTGTVSIGSTLSLAAVQSDIDTAATGNLIDLVPGEKFTALSSGAFSPGGPAPFTTAVGAEKAVIDVVTGSGVSFLNNVNVTTNPTAIVNFGGYSFKDTGVVGADGATAFNLATDYTTTYGATLTGNFAAAQGTGGKVYMTTDIGCTTPVAAGATSTINSAGTTATFTGLTAVTTGTPYYVCMKLNTALNVTVPSTTPSLIVTLPGVSGTSLPITTTAASLYPLTTNGAQVYVRSYVPAAAVGYQSFIRVINTGGVSANVNAAVVSDTTGLTGTSAVIIHNLAPGAAATLASSAIEAAIGGTALSASDRPRLLITGPTTIAVQSFIYTSSSGDFNEVSSGSTGGQ